MICHLKAKNKIFLLIYWNVAIEHVKKSYWHLNKKLQRKNEKTFKKRQMQDHNFTSRVS